MYCIYICIYIYICVCDVYLYVYVYIYTILFMTGRIGSLQEGSQPYTRSDFSRGRMSNGPGPSSWACVFPKRPTAVGWISLPPKGQVEKNRFQSVPLQMLISYEFSYDIHPSCCLMLLDAGCISRFGMIWDDHHTPQVVSKRLRSAHKSLLSAVVDRDGFSAKTGGPTLPVGIEM
jgi:hypothetical protein